MSNRWNARRTTPRCAPLHTIDPRCLSTQAGSAASTMHAPHELRLLEPLLEAYSQHSAPQSHTHTDTYNDCPSSNEGRDNADASAAECDLAIECLSAAELPPVYQNLLSHSGLLTPTLQQHHASHIRLQIHSTPAVQKEHDSSSDDVAQRIINLYGNPTATTLTSTPLHSPAQCPSRISPQTDGSSSYECHCFTPCRCHGYSGVVSWGYIRIHMHHLSSAIHRDVMEEKMPFGEILLKHHVHVKCNVTLLFQIRCQDGQTHDVMKFFNFPPPPASGSSIHPHHTAFHPSRDSPSLKQHGSDSHSTTLYGLCNQLRDEQQNVIAEVIEVLPPIHQLLI